MKVGVVAALAANQAIGVSGTNSLPWRLPQDLRQFKHLTLGGMVVMGERTYRSIGKPLPGRRTVVLSRTRSQLSFPESVLVMDSPAKALEHAFRSAERNVWVVGGSEVYRAFLSLPGVVTDLHITRLSVPVAGDVFFPSVDWDKDWTVSSFTTHHDPDGFVVGNEGNTDGLDYTVTVYNRRNR